MPPQERIPAYMNTQLESIPQYIAPKSVIFRAHSKHSSLLIIEVKRIELCGEDNTRVASLPANNVRSNLFGPSG